MSRNLLQCTTLKSGLNRTKSERAADARHGELTVAAGKHALQISAVDLDTGKARPARDVLHRRRKGFDISHGADRAGVGDPTGPGDADEVDGGRGVARLSAGLAIDLVIQHHDGKIC